MKRGSVDITNPMRGSTPIQKVMRGTSLVWERVSLPRIYAVAKSAGSRIEYSDDLGATWNTSTLNPSSAGSPTFISATIDGDTILIGVWNDNPVQSLNAGSSFAKITTSDLQFAAGGAINGGQGKGYIADLNTYTDLISNNEGISWGVVSQTPPDSRLKYVGVSNIGIIIAARQLQTQYYYFDGFTWGTNSDGSIPITDLCVARNNLGFYTAHADSVSYIPDIGTAARNKILSGSDLSVACSADGVFSLVGDRDSSALWLSDNTGGSYTDISSRITLQGSEINLEQNTCISSKGKYMVVPDQGCVHVSDDFGATFTKRTLFFGSAQYAACVTG